MKTVLTVINLQRLAESRATKDGAGVAVQRRKVVGGYKYDTPQEVYTVEHKKDGMSGDVATLWHHGTKTAEVWLADTPQVLHVYGESRSDADSINTFLDIFGIETRYTYKPVNGGFQEVAQ